MYGDFSRRTRAANSAIHGPIWSNFELVQDFMVVLLTCKNEEDPIKNRGARVFNTLNMIFLDVQGQIVLVLVVVYCRNMNSFKLSYMSSLPARMRMIDLKMKKLECSQDFSHYKCMGIHVLLTCKNEVDQIKFRTRPRCYGCPRYLPV